MKVPKPAPIDGRAGSGPATRRTPPTPGRGESATPSNLTSDATGIGSWTEANFVRALKEGKHLGVGRPINPPMPWPAYRHATEDDLKAVFAYLKTVPPVKNQAPEYEPPRWRGSDPRVGRDREARRGGNAAPGRSVSTSPARSAKIPRLKRADSPARRERGRLHVRVGSESGRNGRGGRIRTADLLLPKQLRYPCATPRRAGFSAGRTGMSTRGGRRTVSRTVLLLHGLGGSAEDWTEVAAALPKGLSPLALDFPGFGKAVRPHDSYDPASLARWVLGEMDDRDVETAVVAGHSLGGRVAGELAVLAPNRVRALALVSPLGSAPYGFTDTLKWKAMSRAALVAAAPETSLKNAVGYGFAVDGPGRRGSCARHGRPDRAASARRAPRGRTLGRRAPLRPAALETARRIEGAAPPRDRRGRPARTAERRRGDPLGATRRAVRRAGRRRPLRPDRGAEGRGEAPPELSKKA